MEFFYNLFKYTRKTCVIVTSLVTFALIIALVVGAYYLRDGTILKSITDSFKEIINDAAAAGMDLPKVFLEVNKFLVANAKTITDVANIVFIAGIAFVSAFIFVYIVSGLLALAHQKKDQKVIVVNADRINA